MNIYKIYSLIKDTYKTFRLIKDKNSSFSEIEKGIDLISSSPETVARILSDRIDLPQYVMEWLAVTVNDMKNLISVFADHPNVLYYHGYKNDAYARLLLLKMIDYYRENPDYVNRVMTGYSKEWK